MGTSTSYSAPPSWGPLKATVTRVASSPSSAEAVPGIVSGFIANAGGSQAISQGRGSVVGGGAAAGIAGRLGAFVAGVGAGGLESALRDAGCEDLIGRPVQEVLAGLLDRLGGPASTIDEVDARAALAELQQQYLDDAADAAEVEARLRQQVDRLDLFMQEFFGLYLYHSFCRVFFERLEQRVGEARATSFLGEIRNYIRATLENRLIGRSVVDFDWTGAKGATLTAEIMESTMRVFES